ncbi:ketopantoate reductase C-terminal domain-containing protein [Paenibacillus rhizoplanae]
MDTIIYRKLLINAVINPLTAIWRVQNGELLASPERVHIMKELYTEAIGIFEACGITLEQGAWEAILEVCRATSGNTSSMLADVLAARETEIRWINGSIVNMGLQQDVRGATALRDLRTGRRHDCEGGVRLFGISPEFVRRVKRYSDCSFFNCVFRRNRAEA